MDYQKILIEQYKTVFCDQFPNRNFESLINLFESILAFETPQQTGLQQTIGENIKKAFDPTHIGSVEAIKLLAMELEPFLKKIILILEGSLDHVKKNKTNDVGFPECLEHLRIEQNFSKNAHRYIRNPQAHNSEILSFKQYYADLEDILFTYLFAVYTKYEALFGKVKSEHIFENHYKKVIQDYETRKAAFVDLEVKEYIELIGTEVIERDALRKAEIDKITLIYERIPEKQMMLLGTAGMGKTTTLLFLAKSIAEHNLKKGKQTKPIPVYLTLASFDREEQRIEQEIARKVERTEVLVEEYLKEGNFY